MSDRPSAARAAIPLYHQWDVTVLFGASDVDAGGPVKFGTTTVLLGPDGMSEPHEPLVYGPVAVRQYDNSMQILTWKVCADDEDALSFDVHREMWQVFGVRFEDMGGIRVEGLETRPDGTAVSAAWEIAPTTGAAEN